jgi:hypothetical protein
LCLYVVYGLYVGLTYRIHKVLCYDKDCVTR